MPQIELYTLLELVGDLNDSTEPGSASERSRSHLRRSIQRAGDVRSYVNDTLVQPGDQSNKALQDLISNSRFGIVYSPSALRVGPSKAFSGSR